MISPRRGFLLLLLAASPVWAGDAALVMSLQGQVTRAAQPAPQVVEAFVKLKQGDVLTLEKGAKLQVVYFDGGRQETWTGGGKLEVDAAASKTKSLSAPQVKQLPVVMVKQLAHTPTLDSQGRTGALRLRDARPQVGLEVRPEVSAEALTEVEQNYARLKAGAPQDDLGAEAYRLAALFELRQWRKVEQAVAELRRDQAGNPTAERLAALYQESVKDARD
jgi:hypothetical protein